ncbi:MAG: kinase [Clostridia bacterium]|nr:kinase [Clostridia bacterium]
MLITRTPFRMSFFGGGTDYEEYFSKFGGCVLSTTIDKYCYLSMRNMPAFFEYKNQFTYSKIERFNSPDEVIHPLVRNALKFIPSDRIQIAYDADLPACSGLGSSSAFAVGLLQGLHAMKNEHPDKMNLAKEAIHLERVLCNEAGGVQDQLAAAFGGLNKIEFNQNGYLVTPLKLSEERKKLFQNNLLLLFTGFTHLSFEIAQDQKNNLPATLPQLHEMKAMVSHAEKILLEGNLDDFGSLLHHTWQLKRTLSKKITNSEIDRIYEKAIKNGALGGKLLGAGGGGFMLLYAPEENHEKLKKAFDDFKFVPFSFEDSGTKIIYENQKI